LAHRLASSRALLAALKQQLASKSLPLFDTQRWVSNFDRLLEMQWDVHVASSSSRNIAVSDPTAQS
jgi:hypothetical protein